jgi:hypothetical protein
MRTLGHRTVPVEVGPHYLHSSYHQRLLPFSEFWAACFSSGHSTATEINDAAKARFSGCAEQGWGMQHTVEEDVCGCNAAALKLSTGAGRAARGSGSQPLEEVVRRGAAPALTSGCTVCGPAVRGNSRTEGWRQEMSSSGGAAAPDCEDETPARREVGAVQGAHEGEEDGVATGERAHMYLAQHELFEQVPALRYDIMVRPTRHGSGL